MSLVFLSPALLVGLLAALVPPLIHLISRRRARPVRFAAMEFVLKSQQRTARSMRLKELLLVVVRSLAIAAFAFAIARPVWQEGKRETLSVKSPLVVVWVIDTSASMHQESGGSTAIEQAKEMAVRAVQRLVNDVRFAVIGCGAEPEAVVAQPTFDRDVILTAISDLRAGYGRSFLPACVGAAGGLAAQVQGEGERRVVVFSDLAAHAFEGATGGAFPGLAVRWEDVVSKEESQNRGIVEITSETTSGPLGLRASLAVKVGLWGTTPPSPTFLDLVIDGRIVARQTVEATSQGETLRKNFTYEIGDQPKDQEVGAVHLRLGDDDLDIDNEVVLPRLVPESLKILVVDGAPQTIPFRDEIFYLEGALRQKKGGGARLTMEAVTPEDVSAGRLAGVSTVFLCNVPSLDPAAARALIEFVRAGGGLLMTMGNQVDVVWYNQTFSELLPGQLRGVKGLNLLDDAKVAEGLGLSRFSTRHPIFEAFAQGQVEEGLPGLSRVQTHTMMLIEPDAAATREILIRFSNDAPAMVERLVGDGRVVWWATSIDRDWSDLAIRPGFVPLVQRIARYLGGGFTEGTKAILRVGEVKRVVLPRGTDALRIRRPDGEEVIAEVRSDGRIQAPSGFEVAASEAGDRVDLLYTATDTPGLYGLAFRRPGGEFRTWAKGAFTVMVPAQESDLRRVSSATMAAASPPGARLIYGAADGGGRPLWPWLFLVMVGLISFEAFALKKWWTRGG